MGLLIAILINHYGYIYVLQASVLRLLFRFNLFMFLEVGNFLILWKAFLWKNNQRSIFSFLQV